MSYNTPSTSNSEGFHLTNLDAPGFDSTGSRKRPATEPLSPNWYEKVANPGHRDYYDTGAVTQQPPQVHHHRPEQAHTPPYDHQDAHYLLSELLQTPAENLGQLPAGTLMLTPESPADQSTTQLILPKKELQETEDKGKKHQVRVRPSDNLTPSPAAARYDASVSGSYPTFSSTDSDGTRKVDDVDGRLPIVNNRTKCTLTVNELKRRIGAPEHMCMSTIFAFFRKSKRKESTNRIKELLLENKIDFPGRAGVRQRAHNCFSGLLEDEATELAVDLRELHKAHFDPLPLAQQMICNMVAKGRSADQCVKMLRNTSTILEHTINCLSTRQPSVSRHQEVLKGNDCDLPYHIFNVSTHGFGHVSSLAHYKEQLEICRHAQIIAEKWSYNIPMDAPEFWRDGEKPFAFLSDHEAKHMIAIQCFRILQRLPMEKRIEELQKLTLTATRQEVMMMIDNGKYLP